MENCGVCGKSASQKCSGCNAKFYCSREHQKIDWKATHKAECVSYEISSNETLGRFIVAKRNIKAGELILRENPFVTGPKTCSPVMCLGCHKMISPPVPGVDYYRCTKCSWPLCGKNCETLIWHVDECRVMSEKKFKCSIRNTGISKIEACYCIITPLRVLLLKKSNPKFYNDIMQLVSHLDQRINTKLYAVLKVNLVPFIRDFLKFSDVSETDILNIAGILDTNCFDIVMSSNQINARGIYVCSSMTSHDCVPNTKHFIDGNMEMKMIACVDIKKGETISTSYTLPLKTTIERRHQTRVAKCFDCVCNRCCDPTEMGTFASGIKCQNCLKGIIIPCDPLIESSDWRCVSCNIKFPAVQVIPILVKSRSLVELMNKSVEDCEKLLSKLEATHPPQNVFVIEVKYALSMLYGNVSGYMIEDLTKLQIKRKRELSEQIIEAFSLYEPGLSNSAMNVKFELSVAKIAQAKQQMTEKDVSKDEALEIVTAEMENIKYAIDILLAGSEGKSMLQDRFNRVIKQSSWDI